MSLRRQLRVVLVGAIVCSGCVSAGSSETNDTSGAERATTLTVEAEASSTRIDRRLLGTNVPAWLGPERLLDPKFQADTVASGTTLLRMPGGSWSNAYDWAGCEAADETRCFWTWAARPSDFISFLEATGLEGMWTVSINQTAQSAAAAVAFFNGEVDDETEIGIDRNGVDWQTTSVWAQARVAGGHPDPAGIELWEVGNEVYGGKPEAGGDDCASFGWEDVWTCDGAQYVDGTDDHDGYLDIRAAMLAVDPGISVGGVGVPDPSGWNNWGTEVIDRAGDNLDFYVVHQYAFDSSPTANDAVSRPQTLWPKVVDDVRSALGPDIPIAVTEYNLVAVADRDDDQSMTTVANALYVADSIGQLALLGVPIANQWNLANGRAENGTDYGLLDAQSGARLPQFTAIEMWSEAGSELFPITLDDESLRVYPTRRTDGSWLILVLNLSSSPVSALLDLSDRSMISSAQITSASAANATDTSFTKRTTNLSADGPSAVVELTLPAWSINAVDLVTDR